MKSNPLNSLRAVLRRYDPVDVLIAAAALQLVPENAERESRLIALAHTAASLPEAPNKPGITHRRLERMCSARPLGRGTIAECEDPYVNPFTEAFTFIGGSYIVLPGNTDEATFDLRHLAKALFLRRDPFPDQEFLEKARDLLVVTLALSDAVARRAGLDRNVPPVSAPGPGVVIPDAERFRHLRDAVTLDLDRFHEFLAEHHLPASAVDALIVAQGAVSAAGYEVDHGDLLRHPLVQAGNRLVVALPSLLPAAVRHAILRLAVERGVASELAERYTEAVWGTVEEALLHTSNLPTGWGVGRLDGIPCSLHGFFHLDADKVLHVALVTDPLTAYEGDAVFGEWPVGDLPQVLLDRIRAAAEPIYSLSQPPNDVLQLVLIQGVGRLFQVALRTQASSSGPAMLAMSAADLETITFLELGDQLALWKYAQAQACVWRRGSIFAPTVLDDFAFYRMNDHSFFSPQLAMAAPPVHLVVRPGGAGDLRAEALQKRDWHAAPAYIPQATTEVVSFMGSGIPIYVERGSMTHRLSLLVEGLPLPIWITGARRATSLTDAISAQSLRNHEPPEEPSLPDPYFIALEFVQAVAYWLWQCTPSLVAMLAPLANRHRRVLIRLRLHASEAWHPATYAGTGEGTGELWRWRANPARAVLQVTLLPAIKGVLATPDNLGERALLLMIVQGLRALLPDDAQEAWPDGALEDMVERYAPLGLKKHLIAFDHASPELDPRGLPSVRKVQEADAAYVSDDLGTYLLTEAGLRPGIVPDEQRQAVFRLAVDHLYDRFQQLVSTLRSDELLEMLLALHEALVRERAWSALTVPTRLACFSTEDEMVKELQELLPDLAAAGVASRFLIEYVAAQPPSGLRPMSLEVYDHLMALAAQLADLGTQADLLQHGLADLTLVLAPAGRLIVDRKDYPTAIDAYVGSLASGEIGRAAQAFPRYFSDLAPSESAIPDVDIDAATTAEFGLSLTDLLRFMIEIRNLGDELDQVTPKLPHDVLLRRVADTLGWPVDLAQGAFDLLSLRPLVSFFPPPAPFTSSDVFPWHYNRALSFLRRPLVQRGEGDIVEVIWGPRHLYAAMWYLLELCWTGRLHARTEAMQQLMSRLMVEQGRAFNDAVADLVESRPHLLVRRRVDNVGKLHINTDGKQKDDLGDLDVLVVDPQRLLVRVIETKDIAGGRTPREIKNEFANLFPQVGNKRSIIEKHQRRTTWVRAHLKQILEWIGVGPVTDTDAWQVQPLIVVDRELVTPFLRQPAIPIVAFEAFRKEVAGW